jgi:hypothetical protein
MNIVSRRSFQVLSVLLATLVPVVPVAAAETVAVAPADLSGIRTLDEVVVTGKLDSLPAAREAVIAAEDRFYARYNELNKDDMLDVQCRFEQPTGTRIPRRTCGTRMLDEETRAEAQTFVGMAEGTVNLVSAQALNAPVQAELRKRVLALTREDPQLLRALLERARLEQYYEDLSAKKFRTRKVVWE